MSTQIAVRLPDEIVAYVDEQVAEGTAKSRADFIWQAVKREQRRQAHERDAAIYAAMTPDEDEFAAMHEYARHRGYPALD